MAKTILIAFDESENSMRAVNFVGDHFAADAKVVLFNVLLNTESMCAMQGPELTPYFRAEQSAFCTLEDKKKEVVGRALKEARQSLINSGFNPDGVEIKTAIREKGVARDIIREAQDNGYDLVVLGKKGLSGIRDFFLGSIPQKVVNGVKNVSVLLVE